MEECCKTCKYWISYTNTVGECDKISLVDEYTLNGGLVGISVNKNADLHGITIYLKTDENFVCSLHEFV